MSGNDATVTFCLDRSHMYRTRVHVHTRTRERGDVLDSFPVQDATILSMDQGEGLRRSVRLREKTKASGDATSRYFEPVRRARKRQREGGDKE